MNIFSGFIIIQGYLHLSTIRRKGCQNPPLRGGYYQNNSVRRLPQGLIVADQVSGLLDIRQTLVPEIRVIQRRVMPVLREQAIVIPLFDDGSLLHDDDTVRGFDC